MKKLGCSQKGHVFFFYRPRVQHKSAHTIQEIQHFFLVLKALNKIDYTLLIIGHKKMPETTPYFAFVDFVSNNRDALLNTLEKQTYETKTRGEREAPAVRCLGEGKYLLIEHEQHTHFTYVLQKPNRLGEVQKDFNLKESDDFLVSVKNPQIPSPPHTGLSEAQKANYPQALQNKFQDKHFIPLSPPEFLYYPGAEILFIGKTKTTGVLKKIPALENCLESIPNETFLGEFTQMAPPESMEPLLSQHWK